MFLSHLSYSGRVRSFRWKGTTWEKLHLLESEHNYLVKTNKIAEIAVNLGITHLQALSPQLQARILEVNGEKPLSFQEEQQLRSELQASVQTGRMDTFISFRVSKELKENLSKMRNRSEFIRSKLKDAQTTLKEDANPNISTS